MEIIELNSKNIIAGFDDIISSHKECIVYGVPDDNYIYVGRGNTINEDFAKKHNVKVLEIPNEGGTIVISKGDVDIGIFRYNGFGDGQNISNKILKHLKEKIPNIELFNNDFSIKDDDKIYKLGSYSSRDLGDRYVYTAIHLSININLELIKGICKKEMVKIPKALSEYGITTEEMISEIYKLEE